MQVSDRVPRLGLSQSVNTHIVCQLLNVMVVVVVVVMVRVRVRKNIIITQKFCYIALQTDFF